MDIVESGEGLAETGVDADGGTEFGESLAVEYVTGRHCSCLRATSWFVVAAIDASLLLFCQMQRSALLGWLSAVGRWRKKHQLEITYLFEASK